jgi:hypothetical protein
VQKSRASGKAKGAFLSTFFSILKHTYSRIRSELLFTGGPPGEESN